jgi:uncharacterized protein with HEPN domain
MSKKQAPHEYLQDILAYLARIESYTQAGQDAFNTDTKTQDAVIRCYEVIGEITKRLPSTVREANPRIDWRTLAGFRDFLSHNYDEIILDFVWQAIQDLPNLRAKIQAMLEGLPADNETSDDN